MTLIRKAIVLPVLFLATMVFLSAGVQAEQEHATRDLEEDFAEDLTPNEQMSELAAMGLEIAREFLMETGEVYPFGMTALQDGSGELVSYSGEAEEQPPVDEWSETLFANLRYRAATNADIEAVVLIRKHEQLDEQGVILMGLVAHVDHRRADPVRVFLPVLTGEDSEYSDGEPVYQESDEAFF